MNIPLLGAIVSIAYLILKMGINYKSLDPKAYLQDAVLVFAGAMTGLYAFDRFGSKPVVPKIAEVFTEKPPF